MFKYEHQIGCIGVYLKTSNTICLQGCGNKAQSIEAPTLGYNTYAGTHAHTHAYTHHKQKAGSPELAKKRFVFVARSSLLIAKEALEKIIKAGRKCLCVCV